MTCIVRVSRKYAITRLAVTKCAYIVELYQWFLNLLDHMGTQ